jgi:hypothetical protein
MMLKKLLGITGWAILVGLLVATFSIAETPEEALETGESMVGFAPEVVKEKATPVPDPTATPDPYRKQFLDVVEVVMKNSAEEGPSREIIGNWPSRCGGRPQVETDKKATTLLVYVYKLVPRDKACTMSVDPDELVVYLDEVGNNIKCISVNGFDLKIKENAKCEKGK